MTKKGEAGGWVPVGPRYAADQLQKTEVGLANQVVFVQRVISADVEPQVTSDRNEVVFVFLPRPVAVSSLTLGFTPQILCMEMGYVLGRNGWSECSSWTRYCSPAAKSIAVFTLWYIL